MEKWLEKFNRLTDGAVKGLKKVPSYLRNNKRLILKLIIFTLILGLGLMSVIWVLTAFVKAIEYLYGIWVENRELIIIIFVSLCMLLGSLTSQISKHRDEKERRRQEELLRQKDNASTQYAYLRLFLYKILDERLCSLIEVVKPVTPNLLNAVTPITIDDRHAIIYYNFKLQKTKTLPFSQGTDYVSNLISSHVIAKTQIEGIEGITAPVGDCLITPVHVDSVKDLGSTAIIVLVLDCEAYRELKGLKWSDIKGNYIYVQRFINDENEVIEDIKGHQEEGKRFIPLTDTAKQILDMVKQLNPNSEYLFVHDGKPLATVTFNRRIKKCCEELGIEYRSSHKVRFSTASIMYKNGVGAPELQKMLGHTTLAMTTHYLRSVTPKEDTLLKMNSVLG